MHPDPFEPPTSVIEVDTEILTKSSKKHLRCETREVKRGLNDSNEEIIIETK
jgi:hypothetical protein